MLDELLGELSGRKPGKAGGLAAISAAASAAALFAKCRYEPAGDYSHRLAEWALEDGEVFERYLSAKRQGKPARILLERMTEVPLLAAEAALNLLEDLPRVREVCPSRMVADIVVGAHLLEAAVRGNLELVTANLRLFDEDWIEGQSRLEIVRSRLEERDAFRRIFSTIKTIAVVGISNTAGKPAFYVPSYLRSKGYIIWGVHPAAKSRQAELTVRSLQDLEMIPDLVLFFRRSEKIADHLCELLSVGPKFVWLQQGIRNASVRSALESDGIEVVSDRCAMLEHQRICY